METSDTAVRVRSVSASWVAGAKRAPGTFELSISTVDGHEHTIIPSAEAVLALVALARTSDELSWDPNEKTLVVTNVVG